MILDGVCHPVILFCRVILNVWCSPPVFSLSFDEHLGIIYEYFRLRTPIDDVICVFP